MAQHGGEHAVGSTRIDSQSGDLAAVAKAPMDCVGWLSKMGIQVRP